MVKIVVSNHEGTSKTIEAKSGLSLMESLRNNGIDGVTAECGGSLSCATCHVIVDADWLTQVGEISDMEDDMLDCTAADREQGSRLSCQIELSDALDGLRVTLPENQI
jgi:2Fe-2S ferredoxin